MARHRFSGDRKGQHPKDHLARFRGWIHADGYAGFEDLYRSGAIREVACMAHVRRKFVDIHRSQGPPIAEEAIGRIAQLNAVDPNAWLADTRARIPDCKINKVDDLLPWRWNRWQSGRTVTDRLRPLPDQRLAHAKHGRRAASQIAPASAMAFFWRFGNGFP